nr:hypothetical protein [Tanacetum cinerariifolium]
STEKANDQEAEEGILYGCDQKQLGWRFKDFKGGNRKAKKERSKLKEGASEDIYVQALQVKHPIIDWKVHTEGQKSYWQIIRLGGSSACY